jgi:hypothetical protein
MVMILQEEEEEDHIIQVRIKIILLEQEILMVRLQLLGNY